MAIFIDLKVATNGNYLLMTEVAKNGIKWLHIIAKNGNKQNDLQLYRELKSLFCHFWQYFAFSSVIILSKNGNNAVQKLPKWQFLLTSKLPKMANEHTWKTRMRMNLDHVASGYFVLGRDVPCEFDYWPLAVSIPPKKVCQQCKVVPVRRKTCECCNLVFRSK